MDSNTTWVLLQVISLHSRRGFLHRYRKRNPMQPGCMHIKILTAHDLRLTESHVQVGFRFACDISAVGHFLPKTLILPKNFRSLRSRFYLVEGIKEEWLTKRKIQTAHWVRLPAQKWNLELCRSERTLPRQARTIRSYRQGQPPSMQYFSPPTKRLDNFVFNYYE